MHPLILSRPFQLKVLHSLCRKAPCHTCLPQAWLAPPSPALLFHLGKSQLCARPWACTTLFTLCFLQKASWRAPGALHLKRRVCLRFFLEFWVCGGGVLCVWGFCVFGVSVCLGFVRVPSLQLQISLCIMPSPRKSAIVQFIVSLWCNFAATTSEIFGANMCFLET